MRIYRLLSVLTILMNKEKLTIQELADQLEVSVRTIRRDIEELSMAGIPVITYQGRNGGIAISNRFSIQKHLYMREDIQNIFISLQALASIDRSENIRSLLHRISTENESIGHSPIFDIDISINNNIMGKIEAIKKAMAKSRFLFFVYYGRKSVKRRVVEPYQLYFRSSSWYLHGYCTERHAFRTFKLSRMFELTVDSSMFIPRDVPPLPTIQIVAPEYFRVKILFSPYDQYRIVELFGSDCIVSDKASGMIHFEKEVPIDDFFIRWVLSFGPDAKVLEPQHLVKEMMDRVKKLMNQYFV